MGVFSLIYSSSNQSPGYGSVVKSRLQSLANSLSDNLNNHTVYMYDLGQVPYKISDYSNDTTGKKKFLEDCVIWLDDNKGLYNHENVCVSVDAAIPSPYGYGAATSFSDISGKKIYASYVNANAWVIPKIDVKLFSWHEPLHTWMDGGGKSDHANAYKDLNSSDKVIDITPMGASYVVSKNGDSDTMYRNQHPNQQPTYFCGGEPNYIGTYASEPDKHDIDNLSSCTLSEVGNFLDNVY